LVQFGELARVTTGFAAISFATMVILTMLATESFDTRLLWDDKRDKDENE
jgi:paraquat-inducible protein A